LERYFVAGEDFDLAQALVDQATAYLALGNLEAAFDSFEHALKRERVFPHLRTNAALELPYQIALAGQASRYERALDLLTSSVGQLMFPADRFLYHTARALIFHKSGQVGAREEARLALEAAASDNSGFRYHPNVGLVSERHAPVLTQLRGLCDA
jgi:tetratricopeptide (TPR) repeat protein